jgi:hypothetical protein
MWNVQVHRRSGRHSKIAESLLEFTSVLTLIKWNRNYGNPFILTMQPPAHAARDDLWRLEQIGVQRMFP